MLRILFVAFFLLIISCSSSKAVPVSASIPLDSWIYTALDKLSGLGLIHSSLQATRPYTEIEASRMVMEARRKAGNHHRNALVNQLLNRLERHLRLPLSEFISNRTIFRADSYIKPIKNLDVRYVYRDGLDSTVVLDPTIPPSKIDSNQFLVNHNNFGIDYDEGKNGQLTAETEIRFGGFFLLNARPILQSRNRLTDEETEWTSRLLESSAILGLGPFQISAGRQALWWGQGYHGTLILSNNAAPLDMIRITNPSPVILPWIFQHLGAFKFDFFLSELEADRFVPEPFLTGIRFNFKPAPFLEIGASRTIMFGGEGVPSLSFSDYLEILAGEHPYPDNSNSIAALDIRLKCATLANLEIYGELGAEDSSKPPFGLSDEAFLVGIYLPQIEPSGRLGLRLEHADFTESDDNKLRWYVHHFYQSGYTFKKKVLGHFAGTDAKDYFVELSMMLPDDLTVRAAYTYLPRGFSQPIKEEHDQLTGIVEWGVGQNFQLNFSYAHDHVENYDFLAGNDRDFHFIQASVSGHW